VTIFLRADATGRGPAERAAADFETLVAAPGPDGRPVVRREFPMRGTDGTALLLHVSQRPFMAVVRCANAVLTWTDFISAEDAQGLTQEDLDEHLRFVQPTVNCGFLR
jgi:hypothetical protein